MEIGVADLAEIFEDPLLNDLADNFLNDIDIHELGDFSSECAVDQTDPSLPSDSFAKSNHATLEALLKSQPLRTCVPPAPDLQSGINMATKTGPSPKIHSHFNSWDPRQQRNGSNPILIPQYTANKPKTEAIRISPRSRLICDYLGKCPGDSNTRYPPIQKSEADFSQQNSDSVRSESTDWDYPSNERRASHVSKSFRIQGSNVVWSSSPLSENGDSVVTESTKVTEKPVRRAPHNAIEKRYRASINGRIDELRKILIPFPSADAKLNKSAVLRQAVDRIKELEKKNERLLAEVRMWRQLHAVHVAKTESNSSPESGISLDPSPIPSNFNAHGFGRFSPPSVGESCVGGGGGGSLYSATSTVLNAPSTASPAELTSLVDMKEHICPTPWSFSMSSPEKPDSTGFPTGSNGGVPQLDTLFDEYLFDRTVYGSSGSDDVYALHADVPSHKSAINRVVDTNDCGSYTVMTPGPVQAVYNTSFNPVARNSQSRGKRGNCATNGAPTKLRRSLTSNAVRSGDQSFGPVPDSALSQPADVQFQSTMSDPYRSSLTGTELSLPGVHRVLSQPPVHPGSNPANARSDTCKMSDTHERVGAVSTTGSRFHNLAARTTLCVSALCLVALDPSVLTSKTIGSESTGTGTGTGTARRLLTISSSLGSSFSSWINCTLYLVQWLVALLFCFWAWKRGTVRTATGRSSRRWRRSVIAISDLAAARAHWVKANNAINQGAMNLSVKNLHQCLVDLAQPLPLMTIQNGFGNKLISWSSLSLSLANLCCIRIPFFVCRTGYNRLSGYFFHTRSFVSSTSNEAPSLTAAMVRSRLLELCVLERHHSVRSAQMAVDRLSFAHLLVRCCHEFLDAPTDGNPDQWARKGVVLALAVGHVLESPRLCRLILRWTSNRIVKCNDRHAVSFWCHIAANPSCVEILTNQARSLTLSPVVVFGSTTLYRLTDRLRNALQKQLTTLCLQSMLYASSRCELDELRASVESLLILIPCTSPMSKYDSNRQEGHDLFEGITNAGTVMSDRNRWWSELFYAVWLQRYGSDPVSHSQVASSALQFESPPTTVLECPHTGILARALWLLFGAPTCEVTSAKQACRLLKKSIQSAACITRSTAEDFIDPFQITAWHWLALDRVLSIVIDSLMPADDSVDGKHHNTNVDRGSLVPCLTTTLHLLRQLSAPLWCPCTFEQPRWIKKRLSYAETVHRLVLGANPVRTRLALLQYQQTTLNRPPSPLDREDTEVPRASAALPLNFRRASTPSQDSGLEMLDRTTEDTSLSDSDPMHVHEGDDSSSDAEEEDYEYDDEEEENTDDGVGGVWDRHRADDSALPDETRGLLPGKCDKFDATVHTVLMGQGAGLSGCVSVTQSIIL